jgi:hypothetical protein
MVAALVFDLRTLHVPKTEILKAYYDLQCVKAREAGNRGSE